MDSGSDDNYSQKLKDKITTQAKRLTKLECEKEELIELLKEKNISSDNSLSSIIISKTKQSKKTPTIKSQTYNNELEKYKKELSMANNIINELKQNSIEMNSFKEKIAQLLTQTTIDVEKSKKSLSDLQKERDDLTDKVIELEHQNKENQLIIKEKNMTISEIEATLQRIQKENNEMNNLQHDYNKLEDELGNYNQLKELYNTAIIEMNEMNQNKDISDKEIHNLIEKNKKLYKDNKELAKQLKNLKDVNFNLNKEINELKGSNVNFAQNIEVITKQLSEFQNKVENNINSTLRASNVALELEQKKKDFMRIISSKDIEISKLKELNNHYITLEEELSDSLKEKEDMYIKLKTKYDSISNTYKKNQYDTDQHSLQLNQLAKENQIYKTNLEKVKNAYDQLSLQYQSSLQSKKNQITALKEINQTLEEKTICLEKNKNYYEHLILKTHQNPNEIKDILDLYSEIIGLERQRKVIEREVFNIGNKDYYDKTIGSIDKQINQLKDNLRNMERDIVIMKRQNLF